MAAIVSQFNDDICSKILGYAISNTKEAIKLLPISKKFKGLIQDTLHQCISDFKRNPFIQAFYPDALVKDVLSYIKFSSVEEPSETSDIMQFEYFFKNSMLQGPQFNYYVYNTSIELLGKFLAVEKVNAYGFSINARKDGNSLLIERLMTSPKLKEKALDEVILELICDDLLSDSRSNDFIRIRYGMTRVFHFFFFQLSKMIDRLELANSKSLKRKLFYGKIFLLVLIQVYSFCLSQLTLSIIYWPFTGSALLTLWQVFFVAGLILLDLFV